jgi:ferredoxin
MRSLLVIALLTMPCAAGLLTFSTETGKPVVTWGPVDGDFERLVLRAGTSDFDSSSSEEGVALLEIFADSVTGEFPESAELRGSFVIDPAICIGCGLCISRCPTGAISLVDMKAVIDPAKCIACGLCVSTCPTSAIFAPVGSTDYGLYGISEDGSAILLGVSE